LRVTESHISTELSRGLEQSQSHQISGDSDLTTSSMNTGG
jgi:hypothetical protein